MGAKAEDDRIRASVGGGDDRRAAIADNLVAPGGRDRRRRVGADLQNEKSLPRRIGRAIRAIHLERDKDAVAGAPNGWGRDGPHRGHMGARELAADAAEVVAIEQIGVAVFSDGEDQLPDAPGARDVEGNRRGAAEIEVVVVEIFPVRRGEIVALGDRAGEVGTETQHRFAVAPFLVVCGVAGRGEQRLSVAGDASLRPDAAGSRARREAHDLAWLCSRKTDDPPVIDAAIAGEAAIGNKDPPAKQGQRAALVLRHRVEASVERGRHVDRPAGLDRPVGERNRVDFVPRMVVAHDHCVEIKGRARFIDDRRAGHAERPDIAAAEPGAAKVRDGLAERPHPDLGAGRLVERVDFVLLGRHDQHACAGLGVTPQQRLRIDLAAIGRVEREVGAQAPRALIGEARHDIPAGAVERAVVGEDGRIGRSRNGSNERCGERAGEHYNAHVGLACGVNGRSAIIRSRFQRASERPRSRDAFRECSLGEAPFDETAWRLPSPALLGKAARRAGWGLARRRDAGRIAKPSVRI